jgi:hypothetical protein
MHSFHPSAGHSSGQAISTGAYYRLLRSSSECLTQTQTTSVSIFYPAFYLACKWWLKDSIIPLDEIDFLGELHSIEHHDRFDAEQQDVYRPSAYDKFLNTFF